MASMLLSLIESGRERAMVPIAECCNVLGRHTCSSLRNGQPDLQRNLLLEAGCLCFEIVIMDKVICQGR